MFPFLTALPLATKITGVLSLVIALFLSGLYVGHQWGTSACKDAVIASYKQGIEIAERQTVVTQRVVTKYVDRIKTVEKNSQEINNAIPNFIKADHDTFLSGGFRLWHDAAAQNAPGLPDPTRIVDAPIVGTPEIATTIGTNYDACHKNKEQLDSLQQWIREESSIR